MSETKTPTTAVPIKISDVIGMLNAGKTREEIGNFYGLNRANRIRLFQDESLKGIKTKTGSVFTLEHDVETVIDKKNKKAANKEAVAPTDSDNSTDTESGSEAPAPAPSPAITAAQENW